MTLHELDALIQATPHPVILLEGRRTIPPDFYGRAQGVGSMLALRYPTARFRFGNAEGADEAFSKGVASVDSSRLQIVGPYRNHRKKACFEGAAYDSPESLPMKLEEDIAAKTATASPGNKGLIARRMDAGMVAAKAAYLIRDTMKVTGFSEEFPKTAAALFFVNRADPMDGGTGHTVRVCQSEEVSHAFQDEWGMWV